MFASTLGMPAKTIINWIRNDSNEKKTKPGPLTGNDNLANKLTKHFAIFIIISLTYRTYFCFQEKVQK